MADGVEVADDNQPVGGAGQPYVDALLESLAGPVFVDAQDDGPSFEALEAQHVAVEEVVLMESRPVPAWS